MIDFQFTFYHSDQVHIETAVKINCSPREEVTYMWSFSDVEGRTVQPMRTDEDMLDKQTLILSPRSLAPGMYRATVKVSTSSLTPWGPQHRPQARHQLISTDKIGLAVIVPEWLRKLFLISTIGLSVLDYLQAGIFADSVIKKQTNNT